MAVRPYKDNRGRARFVVEFQQSGARVHRRCPPNTTLAQARELEVRLRRELFDVGQLNHEQDVPLGAALQLWIDATLPHRRDKTIVSKAHQWAPMIAGKTLRDVSTVAAAGTRSWQAAGLTSATINRRLCVLKSVCAWAWRQNMISENLSPRIRLLPGERRREVYLTPAQIEKLAKAAPSPTSRSAILLAAYTGLRVSELLRLTSTTSSADSLLVATSKNSKPRIIPVVDKIRPHLTALPIGLTYRQLVGEFWIARERAGLQHVRWHDLRHSCASMLINSGADLFTVSRVLGNSPQTASRYAHLSHETLRAAMEKMGTVRKKPADER